MKRLLPSPVLSAALFLLWLLLNQSASPGTLLLGAILAVVIPSLTASLRPTPVRIRRPAVVLRLVATVAADVLRAGLSTGWALLTRRARSLPSAFVRVPLELSDPNGLAVLAVITCLTSGTAWAELSLDRKVLLLHVLQVDDEAALITEFKQRYERPLMEIFE
ncbi:Na+/H+ antiporter subunit E [Rhodoferax koreense]|uniref:Na+/H+ antiporter subunit E n=1 Tax=Rhodoferax koreensis TaxID=1842727 RepID=A0A1P8K4C9_9BURK|nr:Na+/H+ antiporter subunit E [Rhodoferax koreense]